jgi:putative transposase
MPDRPGHYHRHRYPTESISHSVWLYHRFGLSSRDVDELLFERGIVVTDEPIRAWLEKFGKQLLGVVRTATAPGVKP